MGGAPGDGFAVWRPNLEAPVSKRSMAPAVVLAVLAAGGLGSGIGFMDLSASKSSDAFAVRSMLLAAHGGCRPDRSNFGPQPCADIQDKLQASDTFHNIALGAFIAGGAAAAGTALYLLWPSPRASTTGPVKPLSEGEASGAKRSVVPAVVMGVLAGGGIASGIGLMALSASKLSDAAAAQSALFATYGGCRPGLSNFDAKACGDLHNKLQAADRFQDAAVGVFIVGGVAAVGTALYLLWPAPKTTGQAAVHDIRLTPILGPTSHGFLLSGAF
jgi:hypothetical protein